MTSTNIYTPYTYLIGWTTQNKWYYGVRYAKGCNPSDFWVSYHTSSKTVKQFREEHGEPDVIQIRKVFSCPLKAKAWEDRVLLSIKDRSKWLNKRFGAFRGIVMDEEIRRKMSENHADISGSRNPNYGGVIHRRPEVVESKRRKMTGRKRSSESRMKQSASSKGHVKSSVEGYKSSANNRQIFICPLCGRELKGEGNFTKHFKFKHPETS